MRFLETHWQHLDRDELLYPGSPGVFRRRWNKLLAALGIEKSVQLTPASLRSGGAIAAFHNGATVGEPLWRMRLRSAVTLEHCLQETAAVSLLPSLPPRVRRKILVASCFSATLFKRDMLGRSSRCGPSGYGVEYMRCGTVSACRLTSKLIFERCRLPRDTGERCIMASHDVTCRM